jgi:hypothetical protein
MFSSLLLANYEQQMQFDTTANFSANFSFETRREVSVEINREKCKLKAKTSNGIPNKAICAGDQQEDEVGEVVKDDKLSEPPECVEIEEQMFAVEPIVSLSMNSIEVSS